VLLLLLRPSDRSRWRKAEENPRPQPSQTLKSSSLPHSPLQLQPLSPPIRGPPPPPPHLFASNRPVGSQETGMASGGAVREVGSAAELQAAVAGARAAAVHFWASWCEASKQMDEVFAHLAVDFPHAAFLRVRASAAPSDSPFPDRGRFGSVRSHRRWMLSWRRLGDWVL
jgi:thiol-disulfide isomerase/thioredoxin